MIRRKALDGTPYAGNPHVRFDEGEVTPAATPRGGVLFSKKILMVIGAVVALTNMVGAAPGVGSVTYRQDAVTKLVTVTYVLSVEPGIPILDICTNGVSVGWENVRGAYGDVHKVVQNGSAVRTIYWNPGKYREVEERLGRLDSGVTAVVRVWPTNNPPDVMVVNCEKAYEGRDEAVRYYASFKNLPEGTVNCTAYKTVRKMAFRKVPAAGIVWRMGSPASEEGRSSTYEAQHKVKLISNYYLGVFEVTQSQFARFYSNPSFFKTDGDMRPVEGVSWHEVRGSDAIWPGTTRSAAYASVGSTSFLGKFRTHTGGMKFDLPTEAQWEFACRAGSGAAFPDGSNLSTSSEASWPYLETHSRYKNNSGADATTSDNTLSTNDATAAVGSYQPNRWGFYDMHGNVLEWTLDWYEPYDTAGDITENPCGAASDSTNPNKRTVRGGSYLLAPYYERSANRYGGTRTHGSRHIGFRLCLPLD